MFELDATAANVSWCFDSGQRLRAVVKYPLAAHAQPVAIFAGWQAHPLDDQQENTAQPDIEWL